MSKVFKEDPSVLHIEVGAGRGTFGSQYFPKCFLTDCDDNLITIHQVTTLDLLCSADSLPWPDNRFDKVIMCNPFGYGFRYREDCVAMLKELSRVVKKGGKIIVIGAKSNPYCAPKRIRKRVRAFTRGPKFLSVQNQVQINSRDEYPGYVFETSGFTETFPTFRLELVAY